MLAQINSTDVPYNMLLTIDKIVFLFVCCARRGGGWRLQFRPLAERRKHRWSAGDRAVGLQKSLQATTKTALDRLLLQYTERPSRIASRVSHIGLCSGSTPLFTYRDDDEHVVITMPIAAGVRSHDIDFHLERSVLTLGIKGDPLVIDSEELWGQVVADDAIWEIDDVAGQRCVMLEMRKRDVGQWDCLFKSRSAQSVRQSPSQDERQPQIIPASQPQVQAASRQVASPESQMSSQHVLTSTTAVANRSEEQPVMRIRFDKGAILKCYERAALTNTIFLAPAAMIDSLLGAVFCEG